MAKNTRTYWYDYVDINNLLSVKSNNGTLYHFTDATSQNVEQALQRVNEAFTALEQNMWLTAAVVPINLGRIIAGAYHGSHWVGLAIRRNPETNKLEAFYNDSLGTPMDTSLPTLRWILNNHGISDQRIKDFHYQQQANSYDCGAWTVLNLDSFARTGKLPQVSERDVVEQRRGMFGYVPEPYESKDSAEEGLLESGVKLGVVSSSDREVLDIIEKIQYSFNIHSPSIIKQAKNDDIVVFVGNTRGGKSTVVNYVMGNKLKVVYDEDSFKKVVMKAFDDPDNRFGPAIGTTTVSETTIPVKWKGESVVVIWDCPGFGDNRGIAQDITNAFYIKELLSHARSVKFVLISDFNDLDNGNIKPFIDLLKGLCIILPNLKQLFDADLPKVLHMVSNLEQLLDADLLKVLYMSPSLKQLFDGVSIIFTKVRLDLKDENVSTLLFNKVIKSGISIDSVEKVLVQYFVTNPKSIGIFKVPAEEGNLPPLTLDSSITQAIEHGVAITQDLLVDVTPSISADSEIFLRKHYDDICGTKELCGLLAQVSKFCVENMEIIKNKAGSAGIDRELLLQIREEELLHVRKIVKEATKVSVDGLSAMIEKIEGLDLKIKDFIKTNHLLTKIKFVKFVDQVIKPEIGQVKLNQSGIFINQIKSTLYIMEKYIQCADLYISLKLNEISKVEVIQRQEALKAECEIRWKELKIDSEKLEKVNKEIVDSKLNIVDYLYGVCYCPWEGLFGLLLVVIGVVTEVALKPVVIEKLGTEVIVIGIKTTKNAMEKGLDQYKNARGASKIKLQEIVQKQQILSEIEHKVTVTKEKLAEKLCTATIAKIVAIEQSREAEEAEKSLLQEIENARMYDQEMSTSNKLEAAKQATLNAEQKLLEASEEHKRCEAALAKQYELYELWKEAISSESTLSKQLQKAKAAEKLTLEEVEESKTQDQRMSTANRLEIAKQNILDTKQRLLEASEWHKQCEAALMDQLVSNFVVLDQEEVDEMRGLIDQNTLVSELLEDEEQLPNDLFMLQPEVCGVELELVGMADP